MIKSRLYLTLLTALPVFIPLTHGHAQDTKIDRSILPSIQRGSKNPRRIDGCIQRAL